MCFYCKCKETVQSLNTHVVTYKNSVIVTKNVPCVECAQCGEKYYTDEIRVIEALTKKIAHVIQQALGISAKVKSVEPQTLVRSEGKAVHVIDNRKLY